MTLELKQRLPFCTMIAAMLTSPPRRLEWVKLALICLSDCCQTAGSALPEAWIAGMAHGAFDGMGALARGGQAHCPLTVAAPSWLDHTFLSRMVFFP